MRIHFVYESPVQLTPECVEELREYVKKRVKDMIARYGVYEIYVEARPRGSGPPPRASSTQGRMWFEEELERGEAGV